jgi:hypothetical protein
MKVHKTENYEVDSIIGRFWGFGGVWGRLTTLRLSVRKRGLKVDSLGF